MHALMLQSRSVTMKLLPCRLVGHFSRILDIDIDVDVLIPGQYDELARKG